MASKCYIVIEFKDSLSQKNDVSIVDVFKSKQDAERVASSDPSVWRVVVERDLK